MMMSKAMNRSFANVLFGAFGTALEPATAAPQLAGGAKRYNEATVEDAGGGAQGVAVGHRRPRLRHGRLARRSTRCATSRRRSSGAASR